MTATTGTAQQPRSAWADTPLWDREYGQVRSIPSSFRAEPSRAFVRLLGPLRFDPADRVLDAGCGTGRHSLWLASRGLRVHAVDTSGVACDVVRHRADVMQMTENTLTIECGTLDLSSVPDESYDVIIDSYVSCHILDEDKRNEYLGSLLGRLRSGGRLYVAAMGAADAFYAGHISTGEIATDPANGVSKLLQRQDAFGQRLNDVATVEHTVVETFEDVVSGIAYRRQVLAAVLRRA